MMRGTNDTVTIWNRYRDPNTKKDSWYRHVVQNCSWESEIISGVNGTGAVTGSAYTVQIDQNPNYRDKRTWDALDATGKVLYFTLTPGELIALGDVAFTIDGIAGHTESDAKIALTPDIFTIKVVGDETESYKRAPHYEIAGV